MANWRTMQYGDAFGKIAATYIVDGTAGRCILEAVAVAELGVGGYAEWVEVAVAAIWQRRQEGGGRRGNRVDKDTRAEP